MASLRLTAAPIVKSGCTVRPIIERTYMPATTSTARLSRFAMFAVSGATALSLAACGSSNEAKPNATGSTSVAPTSSSAPSAKSEGHDWVKGLIDSVSGSAIQVSQHSGSATVDFTPSTTVAELMPAQLTDVTVGSCISVHPEGHNDSPTGGSITAGSIRISTAVDGKCPEPKHHQPDATPPSAAAPKPAPTTGQVASVAGHNITVKSADPSGNSSPATVSVTYTTKYTKKAPADAQAIAQGKCILAHGTKDGGGALQAEAITVQAADNGQCPGPSGEHHHH
jgi:hypothetical protein